MYLSNKKENRSELIKAIELFVKTIKQIKFYSIPSSLQRQQHFAEDDENFDYYGKQVDLLNKIATFLQETPIKMCRNVYENNKAYNVIKIELKQALYKDDSINPMLEKNIKNLEEKGLSYLPIIEKAIPIIGEKVLKILTKIFIAMDIVIFFGISVDSWSINLVPLKCFYILLTFYYITMIYVLFEFLILDLIKKTNNSSWGYWLSARLFQLVLLVVYFYFLRANKINIRLQVLQPKQNMQHQLDLERDN